MDTSATNQTNMIRTTNKYCADNASITSAITAFAPVLATSQAKLLLIDQLDQIAIATTKGVTLDSKALRKTMTDIAIKCASAVSAYAASVGNNTLKAKVNYTETELNRLAKDKVDDVAQTIHDEANTNITNAQNFGIKGSDVSDLQTAINLYRLSMQSPTQAKINKADANRQIKKLIRETIDETFKSQMDKMVRTLKSSKPDFVNKYFDARKIINLGTTTGKIRGTVTTQDKKPLTGASIILRLTGQTTTAYQTKSDAQGNFSIANIKPGNYDLECSLTKFNTISETNIKFSPGKELKRKFALTSTIAPPASV